MSTKLSQNPAAGMAGIASLGAQRLLQGLWSARLELSARSALLLIALFVALTQNNSLAHAVERCLPTPFTFQEWRIAASVFVTLMSILLLALIPFSAPRLLRPIGIAFVMTGAVCSYFMDSFGVVIDDSMIVNALRTNTHEAGDLMHAEFWLHVVIYGVLPSLFILKLKIRPEESVWKVARRRAAWFLIVLVAEAVVLGAQYSELAYWGRINRDIRLYVNPTFPIYSAYHHFKVDLLAGKPKTLAVIAPDATRSAYPGQRPFVMLMVVGETARAQNFQLNGYARPTNPRLSAMRDLINFSQASSCGTATAESVPCIFSALGRGGFSKSKAAGQQNILDVLARLKVNVAWWDNDSGCQGVCVRAPSLNLEEANDPTLCKDGECRDGILVRDLKASLEHMQGSNLIVMHMKGSHGPAYFKRYPDSARKFTPDCTDENVQRCSRDEVINAYDNTLVYTDTVLADLIEQLRAVDGSIDSALVFASDHGESLGEKGIYLHGMPYAIAPKEQTTIPMVAWFSSGARTALKLDTACVATRASQPASHDNLFHSILGLFQVHTSIYASDADLFSACRH